MAKVGQLEVKIPHGAPLSEVCTDWLVQPNNSVQEMPEKSKKRQ